ARSDIYSLGGVAYFLLTGQMPFVRETPIEMLVAHVYEQATPPSALRPDVPPDLQEVVMRCLQKEPAKRFQDIDSFAMALVRCQCAARWPSDGAAGWWREHGGQGSAFALREVKKPAKVGS